MTKLKVLFVGAMVLSTAAILAQALPPMFPSKPARFGSGAPQQEVQMFRIGAQTYKVTLSHDDVFDGPEWRPSLPLPLDFGKVEKIARAELRKLVGDDSGWEVSYLGLNRLSQTIRPEWYYVIMLHPKWDGVSFSPSLFSEMITLSGKPGKVEMQSDSR